LSQEATSAYRRASLEPRLRIALVAPPMLSLPPQGYAGTERIVTTLAVELHARGHDVTVFAPGDSDLPCRVVPIVPRALWATGVRGTPEEGLRAAAIMAMERRGRFDVIHSHVDTAAFPIARVSDVPMVTTLHGRLDTAPTVDRIEAYPDVPLIAISESQRRWHPHANWVATIHHGLDFEATPFAADTADDYLALVGRLSREKGIDEAIAVARRTGRRLVMAAKVHEAHEQDLFAAVVEPAIADGIVDWRGEVSGVERDRILAGATATLMLGAWPEPFGLVAIESMATGTPVIARRAGAYPEIIGHGQTGFLVDDLDEAVLAVFRIGGLDRRTVASTTRTRFSKERMVSRYEDAFRSLVGGSARPDLTDRGNESRAAEGRPSVPEAAPVA